jgi:hypothetical protein
MESLPVEIIEHILSLLPSSEVLSVAQTRRDFYNLSRDPRFWRRWSGFVHTDNIDDILERLNIYKVNVNIVGLGTIGSLWIAPDTNLLQLIIRTIKLLPLSLRERVKKLTLLGENQIYSVNPGSDLNRELGTFFTDKAQIILVSL